MEAAWVSALVRQSQGIAGKLQMEKIVTGMEEASGILHMPTHIRAQIWFEQLFVYSFNTQGKSGLAV